MSNEGIVQKAVSKAGANGWVHAALATQYIQVAWIRSDTKILAMIYSHDFAKALWPGDSKLVAWTLPKSGGDTKPTPVPAWQYHLQAMVIAENPLEYLGDNI